MDDGSIRVPSSISLAVPTESDIKASDSLRATLDEQAPLEGSEDRKLRETVISELLRLVREWVRAVLEKQDADEDIIEDAGGKIQISGSYRLGVSGPGADIDAVCIAPRFVTRDDFFTSLVGALKARSDVTDIIPITGARVPIIGLVFRGVDIDLLFAQLASPAVPNNIDLLDDNVLRDVDEETAISLNGPRVTEMIVRLIPNLDAFKVCLRAARHWAKRRGLYSNKMGFLGGVNFAILVAHICQLYPRASPAVLLHRFFFVYSKWGWPKPVRLCESLVTPTLNLREWDPDTNHGDRFHLMPILTPAYPVQNSSYNVSRSTLDIMEDEFRRGLRVVDAILRSPVEKQNWQKLFDPTPFFVRFHKYLRIQVTAHSNDNIKAWGGFVESQIRRLVLMMEQSRLPLAVIYPFPKGFESTRPRSGAITTSKPTEGGDGAAEEAVEYLQTFYIGLQEDRSRLRGRIVNLEQCVGYFTNTQLQQYSELTEDMHVAIDVIPHTDIPTDLLPSQDPDVVAAIRRRARRREWRHQKEKLAKNRHTTFMAGEQELAAAAASRAEAALRASEGDASMGVAVNPLESVHPAVSAATGPGDGAGTATATDAMDTGSAALTSPAPAVAGGTTGMTPGVAALEVQEGGVAVAAGGPESPKRKRIGNGVAVGGSTQSYSGAVQGGGGAGEPSSGPGRVRTRGKRIKVLLKV